MNVKFYLLLIIIMFSGVISGHTPEKMHTKMDKFLLNAEEFIRFEQYSLDEIQITSGSLVPSVRKIVLLDTVEYFLIFELEGKRGQFGIAEEDLSGIINGLKRLKNAADRDNAFKIAQPSKGPTYFENKYQTGDHFELGYMIDVSVTWFMVMVNYSPEKLIFNLNNS